MRTSVHRANTQALSALLGLLAVAASALGFLVGLLAAHGGIALLARFTARRRTVWRERVPWRIQATMVGIGYGCCMLLTVATLANILGLSGTVFWLALLLGFPVAVGVGWQTGVWWSANLSVHRHGSLMLGEWRPAPFFVSQPYVIASSERLKHLVIHGPTGTGKSTLLENLILTDIKNGVGLCVIDPKDDLVDRILGHIPPERAQNVILLDATDSDYPVGFNPFSGIPPDRRSLAASELIAVFRRSFATSWGPRLEHILTNVVLALLETPQATLLDIPRLLLDPAFTAWVLTHVTNPLVREFFLVEFEQVIRRRGDAIEPILNKVGPWLVYPELRNIVGQPRSSFAIRQVMDRGQILLVRIPEGAIGEDIASLLGALIVAKIQLAAHSRVDIAQARRRPFYLYIDEFQHFATSSFTRILTEARAFRLGLICSNQYPEQVSRDLQLAMGRNVANTVQCLHQHGRYHLQLTRLEDASQAGSPLLLRAAPPLPPGDSQNTVRIRNLSRTRYGQPRAVVEAMVLGRDCSRRYGPAGPAAPPQPKARKPARVDVDEE
ncbi:MAG: type IV secretion system DNA-binding domain-containing protein [Dehalococcoidia bacterium]|nr:type IV secretion system DNA-binding domain-containing protein [Dehalococcoidia bacterium]